MSSFKLNLISTSSKRKDSGSWVGVDCIGLASVALGCVQFHWVELVFKPRLHSNSNCNAINLQGPNWAPPLLRWVSVKGVVVTSNRATSSSCLCTRQSVTKQEPLLRWADVCPAGGVCVCARGFVYVHAELSFRPPWKQRRIQVWKGVSCQGRGGIIQ